MLSLTELTAYLLAERYIDAAAVVDGQLTIVDTSRRNHNVMVTAESAVGLFVKQGRSDPVQPAPGWTGSGSLAHEAAVYALLTSLPAAPIGRTGGVGGTGGLDGIRAAIPGFLGHDEARSLLVLEALPDATDLTSYHLARGRFPTTAGARLGAALADLHERGAGPARQRPADFRGRMPWVLGIDRPGSAFYRSMSFGGVEMVRMLQSSPALRAALADLRAGWRGDALIHHDLKWDNCMLRPTGLSGRRTRLALVDWEFADLGDAGWDTGSVFGAYLGCWLTSIPVTGRELPDRYLELAEYPLERMQPAMRAFWRSYAAGRHWDGRTARHELVRAARYAGARLLQTAFERAQVSAQASTTVVCLAQLAENVLLQPAEAVTLLFGLPLEDSFVDLPVGKSTVEVLSA